MLHPMRGLRNPGFVLHKRGWPITQRRRHIAQRERHITQRTTPVAYRISPESSVQRRVIKRSKRRDQRQLETQRASHQIA